MCMYVHLKCHKGPHGSEEGIGFPGAEVGGSVSCLSQVLVNKLGSSERAVHPLTAEPSVQPLTYMFAR